MKVIIIGAGIGGTSAGIALRRLGHDVVIYDRMRENKPVGAALSLWSNGVKVLNWLGLRDEVAALGGDMATMAYRDGITGEVLCDFSLDPARPIRYVRGNNLTNSGPEHLFINITPRTA